jgi:adenosylhomocysteine nucleosidase
MNRTAIIAAMPGELKPLVRGWQHASHNEVHVWRWRWDEVEWIAACAGAGVGAATRAFAEAEKGGELSAAISTGWVGALKTEIVPGRSHRVAAVIDARTGERFTSAGTGEGCLLVTSSKVADEQEKQRLASAYGGDLVDMEAAGVARLAAMRGIPFHCIKGVSDGLTDKLPDFQRFISQNGQFQLPRFVLFSILRPWHWPALMRMGENSRKAALSMAESLLDFLDERGHIRKRNGYPTLKH